MEETLGSVRRCDYYSLKKRWDRSKDKEKEALKLKIRASQEEKSRRMNYKFKYAYPENLPILNRREEIVKTIRENQVLILAGETGSGKTTQIPKFCLEAGRGIEGKIGCTQPRRIAALSVADRIAEELQDPYAVGSKIRFQDTDHPKTFIKIMTDGVLLAETQSDPWLNAYDTLIIDEAHERSLNIDFLLGILKKLIQKRKDLKLIITSATMDTEKFSKAFGNAPVIEVSGRTFPVELRYRPPISTEDSLADQCWSAIDEILSESSSGDILVFLPTEQDIKEAIESAGNRSRSLCILPLYARLPSGEQKRIFQDSPHRKLIFSTNIAETSLTIPGIRFVVDSGLARLARYSPGSGTFGLPVEAISQSSAEQRKGRCGRVAEGICIRLYEEEDYLGRSEFTPPEVLRTNLAEVILRMLSLKIYQVERFPFIDAPSKAGFNDGFKTLIELGAIHKQKDKNRPYSLTKMGREMACIPADPRLSRMLLHSRKEGCSKEALILLGALSIQDPREKSKTKGDKIEQVQSVFKSDKSDFLSLLNIWNLWEKQEGSKMKRLKTMSKEYRLSFRRMKEWVDLVSQFRQIAEENGMSVKAFKGTEEALYHALHRSILSGFLSHVSRKTAGHSYDATRNREAYVFPGSQLFSAGEPWLVSAEMVRTSKLYLRINAAIDPKWLLDLGKHLLKRRYFEPRWDDKRATVLAREEVRIFNFVIANKSRVPYGPIAPSEARDIFIQQGLMDSMENSSLTFLKANRKILKELEQLENKLRRRDILLQDNLLQFYQKTMPQVSSLSELQLYIKQEGDKAFYIQKDALLDNPIESIDVKQYPDYFVEGNTSYAIDYQFEPGEESDGPTLLVNKDQLQDWKPPQEGMLIPGLRKDQITCYLKSLEKPLRKKLLPLQAHVDIILQEMEFQTDQSLEQSLAEFLYHKWGIKVEPRAFIKENLPTHIQIKYGLVDKKGRVKLRTIHPNELLNKRQNKPQDKELKLWRNSNESPLSSWKDLDLKESLSVNIKGKKLTLYPSLRIHSEAVITTAFMSKAEACESLQTCIPKLLLKHYSKEIKQLSKNFTLEKYQRDILHLSQNRQWMDQIWDRTFLELFSKDFRNAQEISACIQEEGGEWYSKAEEIFQDLCRALDAYSHWRNYLRSVKIKQSGIHLEEYLHEREKEGDSPFNDHFILDVDLSRYSRFWEYLIKRTEKGIIQPTVDKEREMEWKSFYEKSFAIQENLPSFCSEEKRQALKEYQFWLEEYKILLFAQGLGNPFKLSDKKMRQRLEQIDAML